MYFFLSFPFPFRLVFKQGVMKCAATSETKGKEPGEQGLDLTKGKEFLQERTVWPQP